MNKGKIYFIRHGESKANVRKVFAGQRDNSKLTKLGKEQAKLAAKELVSKSIKLKKLLPPH